jgi:hypothetical protein
MISTSSILIPDTSKVQFQVLAGATVFGENFTLTTNENGFTDWVNFLPTVNDNDPYTVTTILANGKIISSDPFFVKYGEQKIIQMVEKE